jgi:5-methylthioadenosine/S-adenosylhomocysteine deaminase
MLAKGLADDVSFRTWLYERIYLYDAQLGPEDVYWGGLLDGIALIRSGITCFADPGGPHPEEVARAVEEVGLRGFVSYHTFDRVDSDHPIPEAIRSASIAAAVERSAELHATWHGRGNGRVMVSGSVRNVVDASPALMQAMLDLATERDTIVQMHAAVCDEHNTWVQSRTGYTPIAYLDSIGVLSDRWLFPHGARLSDEEVQMMARSGARVAHCPGPSMHGAYGSLSHGKIPELLAAGVRVGLGCDAAANNNRVDMFQEMYLAATGHKEVRLDPNQIPPEQALELATIGGAAALGLEASIGSLEPGKKADLVAVDITGASMTPAHEFSLIPNLVYCAGLQDVVSVMIDGKLVLRDRRLTTVDEHDVLRRAQQAAERVFRDSGLTIEPRWPFV